MDWAGLTFLVLGRRDAGMVRAPGLYALVRRGPLGERTLLHVAWAASIAEAAGDAVWARAVAAGLNEVHVHLDAAERLDGLQLAARVRRHCPPELDPPAEPPADRAAG